MTVQIIITDPHLMEPAHLEAMASMLLAMSGPVEAVSGFSVPPGLIPPPQATNEQFVREMVAAAAVTAGSTYPPGTVDDTGGWSAMPASTDTPPPPAHDAPTEEPAASPLAAFGGLSGPGAPTEEPVATVPPPPATYIPDRDSSGLPWDARIHASTKAINADGTWRTRRGVEPATVTAVEAELRAILAAPAPATETGQPAAVTPDAAQAFGAVPPPPASTTPPAPITFPQLVRATSERVAAGTLTQADIVAACQSAGIPSLPMLANRPDLIPAVAYSLGMEVPQ